MMAKYAEKCRSLTSNKTSCVLACFALIYFILHTQRGCLNYKLAVDYAFSIFKLKLHKNLYFFCLWFVNLRIKICALLSYVCQDSSVGIATRYGLDCPGIESRWGWDFPHLSRPALRPTQPPVQWVPGLSPGVKRPVAWRWPPTSI